MYFIVLFKNYGNFSQFQFWKYLHSFWRKFFVTWNKVVESFGHLECLTKSLDCFCAGITDCTDPTRIPIYSNCCHKIIKDILGPVPIIHESPYILNAPPKQSHIFQVLSKISWIYLSVCSQGIQRAVQSVLSSVWCPGNYVPVLETAGHTCLPCISCLPGCLYNFTLNNGGSEDSMGEFGAGQWSGDSCLEYRGTGQADNI